MDPMSHRPYPRVNRVLHQVDRHAYEHCPRASSEDRLRAEICHAFRIPPRLLGVREPSSEEKTA